MNNPFLYSDTNKRYHTLDYFYKEKFENLFKIIEVIFLCNT